MHLLLQHSATQAQQEPQPNGSCNTCCQGPTGPQGNPGIPGVPGTNGVQGYIGPKGDSIKGDKGVQGDVGQRGEKGSVGNQGLKGDGGLRGLPGKVGPMGMIGPMGLQGDPGVRGQKGEKGKQINPIQVSAFSAVRSTSFISSSANQVLPFEQVHTNVGDDFDAASGQFTCEVPGLYLFTYGIGTYSQSALVCLYKNSVKITCVHRVPLDQIEVTTNAAILQLSAGDEVKLQCPYSGRSIYSNSNLYTSFSGTILHEI